MKDDEAIVALTDTQVGSHAPKTNPTTSQKKTSDTLITTPSDSDILKYR